MLRVKGLVGSVAIAVAVAIAGPASASAAMPGFGSSSLPVPYGSTAMSDFVNAELFSPTTLAGANTGCKPSSTHPYPVVLVHGTVEDEGSNWVTLSPLLANAGYCVYAFNYGETSMSMGDHFDALGEIAASAGQLSTFVNQVLAKTGASKVDIVGHSQGGMMPNYYIKFLGGASKVHTLIGLAPSNHGTTMSGLTTELASLPFASMLESIMQQFAPSLLEQALGSTFMANLFAGGDTVAGPRYVVIESTHDEIVTPYTNAFLSGANVTNITIQGQCPADPTEHIGMNWDSPSLQNVLNQLSASPNPAFQATCTNYGATL